MRKRKRRRSDRALRRRMRSPGRPPVWRRENYLRFWVEIASGVSSEEAAAAVGVSPAVGVRWFRSSGGISPIRSAPLSERYLWFVEREEIAILRAEAAEYVKLHDG